MKIHVSRVPAEGLREETEYDPKTMDVERFDVQLEQPIAVSSFITRADRELMVEAKIHGALRLSCARCLKVFQQDLDTSALFNYQVAPTDVVDITDDVRQEVFLAYPLIPICQPDCRGLCAVCGQDLNAGRCPHQQE